jgi:hypothetical protein
MPPKNQQESPSPRQKKPKRSRENLPKVVTAELRQWLVDHIAHPYPTEEEKQTLAKRFKLTVNQINNWFINARRRILLPMINDRCSIPEEKMKLSKYATGERRNWKKMSEQSSDNELLVRPEDPSSNGSTEAATEKMEIAYSTSSSDS